MDKRLFEKLIELKNENITSFHMPGHKNSEILKKYFKDIDLIDIDTTEIPGTDNLHNPHGVIKKSQSKLQEIYKTKKSYFLVNGSTSGILSMIMANTSKGDKILINRNCHKSVLNAIYLNELKPVYISPEVDCETGVILGINYKELERILKKNKDIKVVLLNYPTYDGICFDIEKISRIIREKNRILIIDEAHGSHFLLNDKLPKSAINYHADIVVQSAHKNLSGFTQSAFLHVNSDRVDINEIEKYLKIFQSSSPSYILMSSLDVTLDILENEGRSLSDKMIENINLFRNSLKNSSYRVIDKEIIDSDFVKDIDLSKIIISPLNIGLTGEQLEKILRNEYNIQVEYSTYNYCLLIATIFNKNDDYNKLLNALIEIEKKYITKPIKSKDPLILQKPKVQLKPSDIDGLDFKEIPINKAHNKISYESVIPYPPGIPLLSPGELITKEVIKKVTQIRNNVKVIDK